jgi:hypothetical protein
MTMFRVQEIFNAIRGSDTSEIAANVARLIRSYCEADDNLSEIPELTTQIHPLGFLCLSWVINASDSLRVHIWDKNFDCKQSPNWPIHDHIFSFRSVVLIGAVQNKTYSESNVAGRRQWNIFNVNYDRGVSKLSWTGVSIGIEQVNVKLQIQGSQYDVQAGMFHRSILRSNFAVTVLATTKDKFDGIGPRVVGGNETASLVFNRDALKKPNTALLMSRSVELLDLVN